MTTYLSQAAGNTCSISQAAAAAALDGRQNFVAESVAAYKQRCDAALGWINSIPGLGCLPPAAAFYLYINCTGLIRRTTASGCLLEDDNDVVIFLLDEAGVAVAAGDAYGLSPFFRMSIATSLDTLQESCDRIAKAVASVRPL